MSVKTVYVCDVCGEEPKDDDTSEWRIANIQPLTPTAPEQPQVGMPPTFPPPVPPPAMVCHKPSCLTRWAKDQNETK